MPDTVRKQIEEVFAEINAYLAEAVRNVLEQAFTCHRRGDHLYCQSCPGYHHCAVLDLLPSARFPAAQELG